MLINALCQYSDYMSKSTGNDDDIYFTKSNVDYIVFLDMDGNIADMVYMSGDENWNKVRSFPQRGATSGIISYVIDNRPEYVFGLDVKDIKENGKKTGQIFTAENSNERFESFRKINKEFCSNMDSDIAKAFCKYLDNWKPEEQTQNPILTKYINNFSKNGFAFALNGNISNVLNESEEVCKKWKQVFKNKLYGSEGELFMCPIEGKVLPLETIHDKIKINGGNQSKLVFGDKAAYMSYGETAVKNSGISILAAKKYASALNVLCSDPKHHKIFAEKLQIDKNGKVTQVASKDADKLNVIYFSISDNDEECCSLFESLLFGDSTEVNDQKLNSIVTSMQRGSVGDISSLDEKIPFYVVGLIPSKGRITQKFFIKNSFGKILENVKQHQVDFAVNDNIKNVRVKWILNELVSPKAKEQQVSNPLVSALFYSILNGTKYPDSLLAAVVRRVKTDSDNDKNKFIKINDTRIGIIKACLNRRSRLSGKQEEIKMSLDTENRDPAYLCGRLFAALEMAQKNASDTELNSTIKDKFFASACSKPAAVFPRLLTLAQNHLSKKNHIGVQNAISQIMELMGSEFPSTLSLVDQGKFIIGYYQQNKAFYTKKETD